MLRYKVALIRYLPQATPDLWHQIAWNWNWDSGIAPLVWITEQSQCDAGTALLVYWYGGPRWVAHYRTRDDVPEYEQKHYDFIKQIEYRYCNAYYTQKNIFFDPADDAGTNWTQEYHDLPQMHPIPPQMYRATSGTPHIRRELEEGYPQEVLDRVHQTPKRY